MGLSRTEMKILIYNKVKRGIPYNQACKEVEKELKHLEELKTKKKNGKGKI